MYVCTVKQSGTKTAQILAELQQFQNISLKNRIRP